MRKHKFNDYISIRKTQSLDAQEECLATSLSLVTRLHPPQTIVVRLHMRKSNVVILTRVTTGNIGV